MAKPLVSVFIPYYNDRDFLAQSIRAVLNQTYENWELILFNHASTDGSRDIARSFDDARIRHIDAPENLGAGSGYNLEISLRAMRGEFVKLLCADDVMKPDCLQNMMEYFECRPGKDILFTDMEFVDIDGNPMGVRWSDQTPKFEFHSTEKETLRKMFRGWSHLPYPGSIVRKSVLDALEFDSTLIMLFDVSLWVRAILAGAKIGFLEQPGILYRISDQQMSSAANSGLAIKRGYFELFQLLDIYYNITDVNVAKALCPCKFSRKLTDSDAEFIPFVVAWFFASMLSQDRIRYFKDQQSVREISGMTKLHEIMNDPKMRKKIKDKFGFGIRDFRALYSFMPAECPRKKKIRSFSDWRHRIYAKKPGNLNVIDLLFLGGRRVFRIIFVPRHRGAKTQRYTV